MFLMLFRFTTVVQAAFPDKPIKIIVGFPPGGPPDTHARLLIDQLQKNFGQPVIVDYSRVLADPSARTSSVRHPPTAKPC